MNGKSSTAALSAKMFLWITAYHFMCLMVSMSIIALLNNKIGVILAQMFCLAIVLILPYLKVYELGSNDINAVNNGKLVRDNLRGLKIGLLAASPYIVCAVLMLLCRAGVVTAGYISVWRIIDATYLPFNQIIIPSALTAREQSVAAVIISALTVLTEPIVCAVAYRMGLERISFTTETGLYRLAKRKVK